jgi:hypothetical protein
MYTWHALILGAMVRAAVAPQMGGNALAAMMTWSPAPCRPRSSVVAADFDSRGRPQLRSAAQVPRTSFVADHGGAHRYRRSRGPALRSGCCSIPPRLSQTSRCVCNSASTRAATTRASSFGSAIRRVEMSVFSVARSGENSPGDDSNREEEAEKARQRAAERFGRPASA